MRKKLAAMLLAAVMTVGLLPLSACSGGRKDATAASMHLRRTEGTVSVSDGSGKDVPLLDNLGLYSGYGVGTQSASYAWIDLDDVKLAKLDQKSEISIEQEGKALNIELKSGSLFFNVTKPLEADETMNIRTSTMLMGIRGTCGWVEENGGLSRVYLLEGEVKCTAGGWAVQVNAGEMAEFTKDGYLVVEPFTAKDVPAFVVDEVAADNSLAQAILEASGLDVLDPLDPAERLRADYQKIIANCPILDNGAAEGVSYTFNGATFTADEGLTDAVCIDLDGDGTEELLLVIREQGTWNFGRPISRLEVYGSEMGRAVLLDSVDSADLTGTDHRNEYGYYRDWPNYFNMVASGGKPCIHLTLAYQAFENEYLFALEDGALVLIDSADWSGMSTQTTPINPEDGVYTELELPTFPEDVQRKNTLLASLDTAGSPAYYYFAKLVNTDLYKLDDFGDFWKVSWNGTDFEGTHLEDSIIYAKLIDMDQDGAEELLLITEDSHVIAYSWDNTGMRKYELLDFLQDLAADDGIYRKKATGEIYIGTGWVSIGNAEGWDFVSLTDSVHLDWAWTYSSSERYWIYEYGSPEEIQKMEAEMEIDNAEWEKFEAQRDQFELIENLYPYLYGNNYEWQNQLRHTVDEVCQQLMAR